MTYPKMYTKKPVDIEAIQLRANNIYQVVSFIEGKNPDISTQYAGEKWDDYKHIVIENGGIDIKTLEGTMKASFKDYMDQAQAARDRLKKKQEDRKKKDSELVDRKSQGIRFYDKKGSGRIKSGKKIYDK